MAPLVLVAFDGDEPGEDAARYWLNVLAGARRWRSYYGKDANGLSMGGGDVRAWVAAGLTPTSTSEPTPASNDNCGAGGQAVAIGPGTGGDLAPPVADSAMIVAAPTSTSPTPDELPMPAADDFLAAFEQVFELVATRYWRPGLDGWLRSPTGREIVRDINEAEARLDELRSGGRGQDLGEFASVCRRWARLYAEAGRAYGGNP